MIYANWALYQFAAARLGWKRAARHPPGEANTNICPLGPVGVTTIKLFIASRVALS